MPVEGKQRSADQASICSQPGGDQGRKFSMRAGEHRAFEARTRGNKEQVAGGDQPPPRITSCGSKTFTREAIPTPSQKPSWPNSCRAVGSSARAAWWTVSPVTLAAGRRAGRAALRHRRPRPAADPAERGTGCHRFQAAGGTAPAQLAADGVDDDMPGLAGDAGLAALQSPFRMIRRRCRCRSSAR